MLRRPTHGPSRTASKWRHGRRLSLPLQLPPQRSLPGEPRELRQPRPIDRLELRVRSEPSLDDLQRGAGLTLHEELPDQLVRESVPRAHVVPGARGFEHLVILSQRVVALGVRLEPGLDLVPSLQGLLMAKILIRMIDHALTRLVVLTAVALGHALLRRNAVQPEFEPMLEHGCADQRE